MRFFICEKPSIAEFVLRQTSDSKNLAIANNPHLYQFDFSAFEFLSSPMYKPKKLEYEPFSLYERTPQDVIGQSFSPYNKSQYSELFNDVTEINIIMDSSFTSIRATDCFLNFVFNNDWSHLPITNSINLDEVYLGQRNFVNLFNSRESYYSSPTVLKHRVGYRVKDYIDYNFTGAIKQKYPEYGFMTRNMMKVLISMMNNGNIEMNSKDFYDLIRHEIPPFSMAASLIYQVLMNENFITGGHKISEKGLLFLDKLPDPLKNKLPYIELQLLVIPFESKSTHYQIKYPKTHEQQTIKKIQSILTDLFKDL